MIVIEICPRDHTCAGGVTEGDYGRAMIGRLRTLPSAPVEHHHGVIRAELKTLIDHGIGHTLEE